MLWLIPITIVIIGAGVFMRVRRNDGHLRGLTSEPVSGQWLAERRGREEQNW